MMRWKLGIPFLFLAGAALVVASPPARTADHRDGPIAQDQPGDIADWFAFVNPKNGNIVLSTTCNPYTVPGVAASFSPDVLLQFKIDNTGDFKEDLVIQAKFSGFDLAQKVTVLGPARPAAGSTGTADRLLDARRVRSVTGPANGTVFNGPDGIRVFAGRTDDPFFVDLIFVRSVLGAIPPLNRPPGFDLFAGLNVTCFAVEVPAALLRGGTGNTIRSWATTNRARMTMRSATRDDRDTGPFVQIDRMGLPTINTALVKAERKNEFNRSEPKDDRRKFRADALATLISLNNDSMYSNQIVDVLLPDVLTLDMTKTDGFLNGRRPQDDIIDAVLNVVSKGAVKTDAVQSNDSVFSTEFPFMGPEHTPSESIPPRN